MRERSRDRHLWLVDTRDKAERGRRMQQQCAAYRPPLGGAKHSIVPASKNR